MTVRVSGTEESESDDVAPDTAGDASKRRFHAAFGQHLSDYGVHLVRDSRRPANLDEMKAALAAPLSSASSSDFSPDAYEAFARRNSECKDDESTRVRVIPNITGLIHLYQPTCDNTYFGDLKNLTDGTIPPARPDIYFGSYSETVHNVVRQRLERQIIPCTMGDRPLVPNFSLTFTGTDGPGLVAVRLARYAGAIGARAMHALQNFGVDEPVYDGNAYAFSSAYHDGELAVYAHHLTAPTTPGGRPQYHMNRLSTCLMASEFGPFKEGITAFRNAADLAKVCRERFVTAANRTARRLLRPSSEGDEDSVREDGDDASSSDEDFSSNFEDSPSPEEGDEA